MHWHQMAFSRTLKQFHKGPKIKRDNIANERQLELHSGRAGPGKANHAEGRQTLTITTPGYCLQFCTYFKFRHFDLSRYWILRQKWGGDPLSIPLNLTLYNTAVWCTSRVWQTMTSPQQLVNQLPVLRSGWWALDTASRKHRLAQF